MRLFLEEKLLWLELKDDYNPLCPFQHTLPKP